MRLWVEHQGSHFTRIGLMVAPPPVSYPTLSDLSRSAEDRLLALECSRLIEPQGPIPLSGVTHLRFSALTRTDLEALDPTAVVMPLFSADQDALSMVETLEEMGFRGRILVIAPALPRPQLVERELRAAGPGLRLMLVSP